MNVLLFGATGMLGQGVLRECLLDPEVRSVLAVVRSATGQRHPKLREIVHADLMDLSSIERELSGRDACFYCLGASSAGLSEADYHRVTYDLALAIATPLARLNPGMTFLFISGQGTDGTERGPLMWARVKGKTENALLRLPFKAAYMFRPGLIRPLHGIKSRTAWYRVFYTALAPLIALLDALLPKYVTNTEKLGRAMLKVAKQGAPIRVLENRDINRL
jgi:uncharacterized protein YbjT (DUF2867 family)